MAAASHRRGHDLVEVGVGVQVPLRRSDAGVAQARGPASSLLRQIHGDAGSPKQGFVVHSRTGRKMTSLNATWTRLAQEAGMGDVRLHDLRHSFASDALMGGVAIVGEMPGHGEPATTKRYAPGWRCYGRLCESGVWPQIEALLQALPDAVPRRPPRSRPRSSGESG